MIRNLLSFALALALLGGLAAGTASAGVTVNQVAAKWWGGVDSWDRGGFEGRWMADDRMGPRNRGWRADLLPDFLRIDQGRRQVRIADFRNNLVQVILLENRVRVPRQQHATVLRGDLRNDHRLVAYGVDSRGREVKQILALRDKGRILVVRTQIERRNGRMIEIEQTYHKA